MNYSPIANVLSARARLGECPVWDGDRQQLFWVDAYNHRLHQFDPATGQDHYFDVGAVVSAIALTESEQLLLALRDRLALFNPETQALVPLYQFDFPHPDTRLNDGKCDAQGRFWIGSVSEAREQAALYRYDPDGSLHLMQAGLTISNGLGWSPDGATFYLTDSAEHKIYAYDFEAATGAIRNRRVLIDLSQEAVEPDGLAIDTQGNLWSALWDGGCIACFNSAGQELLRIKMPVQRPTSLTFGGSQLTDLYITSAAVGLSQKQIQQSFTAGDLFHCSTSAVGMLTQPFLSTSRVKSA
ncbi:MAG: SMP-30/gluconolactonase/LRE family protein [Aphanocapsa sp. GSE-SYN-MK-11-07L]|nr:SMP-30/gluconolactonase/LRE family protein [Aphanocapsa sp. GSE-SYN-MK-11-07L]